MTTYATNNPLGSMDPKDLFDNAQNMDFALNDVTKAIWQDRFGRSRKTFWGMEQSAIAQLLLQEQRFDLFIESSGYKVIGDYSAGPLTVNEYNQLIRYEDELWKLTSATDLPFTTTGNDAASWVYDSLHFVSVGDAALRQQIADPDGATKNPELQMARWRDDGDIRGWGAKPGEANAAITTAAINATYAARAGKKVVIPPNEDGWYLNATINAGYSNTTTHAYGAKIFSTFDGLMFDFNPSANPSSIELNSKSYINWFGGEFQCIANNPVNAICFRAYGTRQVHIENCIFGSSVKKTLNVGIQIAGLGGHSINKNRFLLVDICIDGPVWATSSTDVSGPITTTSFICNNFTLTTGQKAFYIRGGWNRWIIQGGFVNGSNVPVFHFTNYADCKGLNIIGVGFEQAVAGGKFLYLQDTSGISASSINVNGGSFNGDPVGGGHSAIDLERCINVYIGGGTRIEGSIARNNNAIKCDANCQDVVIDSTCRIPDPGISLAMPRIHATVGKVFQRISDLVLNGYNGDSKSSGTVTLDMKTLLGTNYPKQIAPLAYDLTVQARDSGSAGSATTQLEIMRSLTGAATFRNIINLQGLPNDQRAGRSIHVNAETDGSIAMQFSASGAGTLDVWVYVTAIYN